ncbi:MAG TPA: type III pantothenate kinase [Methylophilaceae bacterium]|jgi:type III pantothenate kinase
MDAVLAVDAGNTRIKWGVYQDRWLANGAFAHDSMDLLPGLCSQFAVKQAVISNVAGTEVRLALQKQLDAMELSSMWIAAGKESCGVKNSYKIPHQLGSDRWAALIAAWQLKHAACVVVNAGTAITIDALAGDGVFMGGMILPGLYLMRASLAENTAELEQVSGTLTLFPQNTGDAMMSGAIQAIGGAMVQMHDTLSVHEKTAPHLLLTGGDASTLYDALADKAPENIEIVENLVLEGLILIYKESYL